MKQFERLTEREVQVASLVADGLSDREIAERLLIARRTAEWHVEQILSKAGLKSRSQIAALVSVSESLGGSLLGGRPRRPARPPRAAAFLGFSAEGSHRGEVLETTRLLSAPPGDETDAKREERLAALAEAGYSPVVVRLVYARALGSVAPQYPDTKFAIVDDSSVAQSNPNVTGLIFADHDGSFLVGAIGAQASRSGIVGFVGATQIPFIDRFRAGFAAGATAVKPDCTVLIDYLAEPGDYSGFSSVSKARAVAAAMCKAGADVVYHAAGGSGAGVFEAAKSAGCLAIGVDSDQYLTSPTDVRSRILTSMLKRVEAGVRRYIQAIVDGSPFPRVARFNLANEGIGYSKSNPLVQPYIEVAEALREKIIARKIEVPDRA